jgi:MATE family, multidrug efflux pump
MKAPFDKNAQHGAAYHLRDLLGIKHGREIVTLAMPIVMTMLSQTLMWTVDTIYLGHFSSLALGGAGLGGILTWTAYSLFNNLSRINSTFVSQSHGKGDNEAVGHYTWQVIYISILSGLILTVAGFYSYKWLYLTQNPLDVQEQTYLYIKWRTVSAVFTQLGFCLMGFFQGRRDVRTPMWAGIISNAVNLVLDPWLIFGWSGFMIGGVRLLQMESMGVSGAAIATSIGVVINFLVMAVVMFGNKDCRSRYKIHKPRRPDFPSIARLVRVGLPSSIENFVDMSSFAIFTSLIGRAGAISLAVSQIQVQLLSFSFMPMWGLTTAGSVLVGNNVGAGKFDEAARYGRQVFKLGVYYSLALGASFLLLGENLYRVFSPDPAVLFFAATMVPIAAVFQFGDGMRMIGSGLLTGAGDTRPAMLVTIGACWGLFIPVSWYLVVKVGGDVSTVWLGGSAVYMMQGFVLWGRFQSGKWRKVKIFGDQN